MTTTTYFTAGSNDEAAAALDKAPTGEEVLTSVVAPDSDAFNTLIRLIIGIETDGTKVDDLTVYNSVAVKLPRTVIRLSSDLVAEIADRDFAEFAELVGPWQRSGALDGFGAVDMADYLIELQHLCRHAIAKSCGVYAVESV